MRVSISDQSELTEIPFVKGLGYLNKLLQTDFYVAVARQNAWSPPSYEQTVAATAGTAVQVHPKDASAGGTRKYLLFLK